MALNTPNDRNLVNVIGAYERELSGRRLTTNEITRLTESVKRYMMDELHSQKAAR
jgi:hypothetical protein